MPDHTYKLVELVGTSDEGINQAIENSLAAIPLLCEGRFEAAMLLLHTAK